MEITFLTSLSRKKAKKKEAGADVVCALACCRCCTLVVAAAVAVENINIARNEQKKPDWTRRTHFHLPQNDVKSNINRWPKRVVQSRHFLLSARRAWNCTGGQSKCTACSIRSARATAATTSATAEQIALQMPHASLMVFRLLFLLVDTRQSLAWISLGKITVKILKNNAKQTGKCVAATKENAWKAKEKVKVKDKKMRKKKRKVLSSCAGDCSICRQRAARESAVDSPLSTLMVAQWCRGNRNWRQLAWSFIKGSSFNLATSVWYILFYSYKVWSA